MEKKQILKIISIIIIVGACFMCFFLMYNQKKATTYQGFYLNTVITLTFYNAKDSSLQYECFALCEKYENLLSRTKEGSDIWNINHSRGKWVTVDPETYELLQTAYLYCSRTGGLVDLTIAPLMNLWNFTGTDSEKKPPANDELDKVLAHVDYRNLEFNNGSVRLKDPNAMLDLGFIAKGYIGDKIKEYLVSKNVRSAIINLGGNVVTIGEKPDGTPYTIGIMDPFNQAETIDTVSVSNRCVITSGTYERAFLHEGVLYHHILNPVTGMPIDNGLVSVTILSDDAVTGDALSTTCLLLGKEKGLEFLKSFENTEAVFIDKNGDITMSN